MNRPERNNHMTSQIIDAATISLAAAQTLLAEAHTHSP